MSKKLNPPSQPPLPPLSGRLVTWVAAVVVFTVMLTGLGLWWWTADTSLDKDLAARRLDVIRIALSLGVAAGGIFALYLAYRRQVHQEQVSAQSHVHQLRVADETAADATERRVTELYTRAVDQLGSDQAPVRLGGLYALERLAQTNPRQRQTIVNVLCAYLRMPYVPPGQRPSHDTEAAALYNERVQEREVRLTAQRILFGHVRSDEASSLEEGTFWADTDLDFSGAVLEAVRFDYCHIRSAEFEGARIIGTANFEQVRFTSAVSFKDVCFESGATFSRAQLPPLTRFTGATFRALARFDAASFAGKAGLNNVHFHGGAYFNGAHFMDSVTLADLQFDGSALFGGSRFDGSTHISGGTFHRGAFFGHAKFGGDLLMRRTRFAGEVAFGSARFAGAVHVADNVEFGRGVPSELRVTARMMPRPA